MHLIALVVSCSPNVGYEDLRGVVLIALVCCDVWSVVDELFYLLVCISAGRWELH